VRSVRTDVGEFEAQRFVLAAGFWSAELARFFGLRMPMRAGKGYSLQYPRGGVHPSRSIYLSDRRITVTPHESTLRIAGTLEIVGDDPRVNERRVRAIVRGAHEMLDLGAPALKPETWVGLRPCLAHGMPVIGPAPGKRNLWLATGHQMTGLKCAPGTARLLADLICGAAPSFDPRPFDPSLVCRAR
jgi:D-amino-acid dehydrogenase